VRTFVLCMFVMSILEVFTRIAYIARGEYPREKTLFHDNAEAVVYIAFTCWTGVLLFGGSK